MGWYLVMLVTEPLPLTTSAWADPGAVDEHELVLGDQLVGSTRHPDRGQGCQGGQLDGLELDRLGRRGGRPDSTRPPPGWTVAAAGSSSEDSAGRDVSMSSTSDPARTTRSGLDEDAPTTGGVAECIVRERNLMEGRLLQRGCGGRLRVDRPHPPAGVRHLDGVARPAERVTDHHVRRVGLRRPRPGRAPAPRSILTRRRWRRRLGRPARSGARLAPGWWDSSCCRIPDDRSRTHVVLAPATTCRAPAGPGSAVVVATLKVASSRRDSRPVRRSST